MQKWLVSCIVLVCLLTRSWAQDEASVRRYIDQYKLLAIAEQKRSGIPAAITLAQGIHETMAGSSELATQANNHFGIKCKKEWTGETFAHTDDAPDECFRKYKRAEDSYLDHSNYLAKTPRYASLFKLSVTDYAGWAFGLKQCGYATNPKYARVLIGLIEDYHLQEYTYDAMSGDLSSKYAIAKEVVPEHDASVVSEAVAKPVETVTTTDIPVAAAPSAPVVVETPANIAGPSVDSSTTAVNNTISENTEQKTIEPSMPPYGQVVKINGLKAVYAKKGDMPLEYAIKNNLRYERLLEINEIDERPLSMDMLLYLERKNYRGLRPTHVVKEGETMFSIAQAEGIQLKNLRSLNMMQQGDEPETGTVLELQKQATMRPALVKKENAQPNPPAPAETTNTAGIAPIEQLLPQTNTEAKQTAEIKTVQPAAPEVVAVGDNAPPVAANEPATVTAPPTEPMNTTTPDTVSATAATPPTSVGPPSSPNDIPKVEKPKAAEPVAVAAPPAKPQQAEPAPEEPKSELDVLKSRFDKVVYAKPKQEEPAAAKEEPKQEETKPATKEITTASATPKYYTVKKGDTAFSIAKNNNITMRQLMDWNSLDFAEIKVGQKLRVQ